MTRAEAIERARYEPLSDPKANLERLYDTALIAGLQRAERIVNRNGTDWITTIEAIRAEITRLRKGAKAK